MFFIPLFIGFQPSKVVQDFFHPQYAVCGLLFWEGPLLTQLIHFMDDGMEYSGIGSWLNMSLYVSVKGCSVLESSNCPENSTDHLFCRTLFFLCSVGGFLADIICVWLGSQDQGGGKSRPILLEWWHDPEDDPGAAAETRLDVLGKQATLEIWPVNSSQTWHDISIMILF